MNSVVTMSWASFNMVELQSLAEFDNTTMIQFWSAALFTVYHTSTMIVLLNMLIAMMANSYQQIEVGTQSQRESDNKLALYNGVYTSILLQILKLL